MAIQINFQTAITLRKLQIVKNNSQIRNQRVELDKRVINVWNICFARGKPHKGKRQP